MACEGILIETAPNARRHLTVFLRRLGAGFIIMFHGIGRNYERRSQSYLS
jgi:hypothetical protein